MCFWIEWRGYLVLFHWCACNSQCQQIMWSLSLTYWAIRLYCTFTLTLIGKLWIPDLNISIVTRVSLYTGCPYHRILSYVILQSSLVAWPLKIARTQIPVGNSLPVQVWVNHPGENSLLCYYSSVCMEFFLLHCTMSLLTVIMYTFTCRCNIK